MWHVLWGMHGCPSCVPVVQTDIAFNMSIPLTNTSSDEVNLSSTLSEERLTCILLMLVPCSEPIAIFLSPSLWHLTTRLNSSPGAAKLACLVDSVVKKAEQSIIILATVASICFDHDSLQSSVTPSSLVTSTCSISTLFITTFS